MDVRGHFYFHGAYHVYHHCGVSSNLMTSCSFVKPLCTGEPKNFCWYIICYHLPKTMLPPWK